MVTPVGVGRRTVYPRAGSDPDGLPGAPPPGKNGAHPMNILVALDFSRFTDPILHTVHQIAAAAPDSKIWLLHVAEPDPSFVGYDAGPAVVRDQIAAEYREEHRQLHACASRLRGSGVEVTPLVIQGAIADT